MQVNTHTQQYSLGVSIEENRGQAVSVEWEENGFAPYHVMWLAISSEEMV